MLIKLPFKRKCVIFCTFRHSEKVITVRILVCICSFWFKNKLLANVSIEMVFTPRLQIWIKLLLFSSVQRFCCDLIVSILVQDRLHLPTLALTVLHNFVIVRSLCQRVTILHLKNIKLEKCPCPVCAKTLTKIVYLTSNITFDKSSDRSDYSRHHIWHELYKSTSLS